MKKEKARTRSYARALEFGIKVSGFYHVGVFFGGVVSAFIKGSAGDRFLSLLATKIPITLGSFLAADKELCTTRRQLQFE